MKTTSNRYRYKNEEIETLETNREKKFKIGIFDIGLTVLTIIIYADLYNKSLFELPVMNYFTKVFFSITIMGFISGFIINFIDALMSLDTPDFRKALKIIYLDVRKTFTWKDFIAFIVGFAAVAAVQFGLKLTQSVTNIDQFNFYVFAGVAEELFFRYFITSAIYIVSERAFDTGFYKKNKLIGLEVSSPKNKLTWKGIAYIISIVISTLITSSLFYFAHETRYGTQPTILLGIFLLSVILTAVYGYTKNVLVCILIHLLNNFAAFSSLLITV